MLLKSQNAISVVSVYENNLSLILLINLHRVQLNSRKEAWFLSHFSPHMTHKLAQIRLSFSELGFKNWSLLGPNEVLYP
jgi:hypothetical protein